MSEYDRYAALATAHQPAVIPSLPEQESDAESLPLPGAPDVRTQAGPAQVDEPDPVDAEDENVSHQIDAGPEIKTGVADEKHEHYWIHTVTETIERGYYDFETRTLTIKEGVPVELFGLDDLRNRAEVMCIDDATGAGTLYFGKRDVIVGADPTQGFALQKGETIPGGYRARHQAFVTAIGGDCKVTTIEYHGEPTSDTLAKDVSRKGKGK